MDTLQWYPANYQGLGIKDSRIYLTPTGQALAVLAEDVDETRADPIVMACGLRPAGNGGECWCLAPLLSGDVPEAPFPNACFATVDQLEHYLNEWTTELPPLVSDEPINDDEVMAFGEFLNERFELPTV